jgi:hypothetical protein
MDMKTSFHLLIFRHPSLVHLIEARDDELSNNDFIVPREYCCNIVGCFDFRNI